MKLNRTTARLLAPAAWRRAGALLISCVLVAALVLSVPVSVRADETDQITSELDEAKQRLVELTRQLEMAQAQAVITEQELTETQETISALEEQITETEAQLSGAQDELADQIAADYKSGEVSLVSVLLSSTSFDELASRIYYANKVADAQSARISGVRDLQQSLEQQQTELSDQEQQLQELLEQQTASAQELASSQSEAESYVNGLSQDLQDALEAERAAAAQQQQQQIQDQQNQQDNQGQQDDGQGTQTPETPSTPSQGGQNTTPPSGGNTGAPSGGLGNLSQAARNTIVATANSQLGCDYGWGAMNPGVSFDCSGLTTYCYAQVGISLGRTAQQQYNQVVAAGNLKTDPSTFVAGDLVFWASGGSVYHVAIYIGGGQITHASDYSTGVITTSVYYGGTPCGGGSPI